ncbi:MAG: hypothetical protein IPI87_00815 [Betaproteobacteria bacterium]|nr:hypothetical protein [Betaproteobacteria bacterium]
MIAAGVVPDPAGARLLASRDPDVVVDAVGLGAATGPWLAQRPGRAIWTLADHEPPLADRCVDASASALAAALAELPRPEQGMLTKDALAARWEAGLRAHQGGDVDAARAAYSAVIDDQPDFAPALHFRARLEWDAGDPEAAARDLASALDAAPGYAEARVDVYRQVVARDPTRDAAWKNLGEVLREEGLVDEWAANFRRFEAACPGSLLLAAQALEVCQFTADFPRLDRYLDGLRQEKFRAATETTLVDALEELLYLLLFFDIEPSVVHRFARTYDQATRRVYGVAACAHRRAQARQAQDRLPVGGPARPRDGQDDVGRRCATTIGSASTSTSIRCRTSVIAGPSASRRPRPRSATCRASSTGRRRA